MLKYEMLAVAALVAAVSCRNVQEYQQEPQSTVMAELTVEQCLDTKSNLPSGIEGMIETVTWAAYDASSGALFSTGYSKPGTSGSYAVSMTLPEGKRYDLYALANAGDLRERIPTMEASLTDFDYMLSDEFSDLSVTGLPMAGQALGVRPGGGKVTVSLKSLVAVYEVDVNIKGLDLQLSSGEYKRVMKGEYISVRNSNRHLVPFSENGSSARSAEDVSSGDGDAGFCAIVPVEKTMPQSRDSVFSYRLYVPENMQGVLLPGNSDPDRKIPDEVDRVNGPDVSGRLTYLEFSFTKTEPADANPFTGGIIYRMYLGRDNCKDFTVERGTENYLGVGFDGESLLRESYWKVEHTGSWNNDNERLEFSSHDITVTPSTDRKLFVWYSGTGVSLEEAIPRKMGIPYIDGVEAATRDEWFFEEDSGSSSGMPGFSELWASDPDRRISSDAIRYVASKADKIKSGDVVGRYYLKAIDSMMGKTAMLVVSDRWHSMRDTCYVHFSGQITMNSSDFNNFRVAQERTLEVTGLPVDQAATCEVTSGKDNVTVEKVDAGAGVSTKTWRITALKDGTVALRVVAGGVSATFTFPVKPVYLGFMRTEDGIFCTLDGAHNTVSYAYYEDSGCGSELSEGSFVPELRTSLLSPCITLDGPYSNLLSYIRSGRQVIIFLSSYSSGGTKFGGCAGSLQLGTLSIAPSYNKNKISSAKIYLKSYRSYVTKGTIGSLTDASGYEPTVLAKVPRGLPAAYCTHVNFNGHNSFRQYSGMSIVNSSGIGKPELWSVGLYTAGGDECTSVSIRNYDGNDEWVNGLSEGQRGETLTARLKVRNLNSGEVFSDDLFKCDCTVFMCVAGAYCNEIGIYGKSSLYEVPLSQNPETFYNSVKGATDWLDKMILIQRDEWNTFVTWGGKIKKYLSYADDFIGIPANAYLKKTKYNLSAGLCFDTYADCLGQYSDNVNSAFGALCNSSSRFITGTVEKRYSYVEFDSSAATQLVLLKFHPSLYFGLMAYHSDANRPVSDLRKQERVYTSSHYDGVDDSLLDLSETKPYPLRTQVQHVFYGDVEDGLCNNQPWRVDFNHRSPSSLPAWSGDQDIHIPFSADGDSSVDELIGQFAPELTFSRGANISGMTFSDGDADYVSKDGTHLKLFFLHEVLSYSSSQSRYTWKNWY